MEVDWPSDSATIPRTTRRTAGNSFEPLFEIFQSEHRKFRYIRFALVVGFIAVAIYVHTQYDKSDNEVDLLKDKFKYELWFGTNGVLLSIYGVLFITFGIMYLKRFYELSR